jgi:hypothetical protein
MQTNEIMYLLLLFIYYLVGLAGWCVDDLLTMADQWNRNLWMDDMTPRRAIDNFLDNATPRESPDVNDLAQVIQNKFFLLFRVAKILFNRFLPILLHLMAHLPYQVLKEVHNVTPQKGNCPVTNKQVLFPREILSMRHFKLMETH